MSSVGRLREFVNERLTAAAEEIFGVFKKTIFEYEEEIDRQRRLLDVVLKPELKLRRIELSKQHVCNEEEVLADQQLCVQHRTLSLDQEDPEPPRIKEEPKELRTSREGGQLVLKQETENFTSAYEESDRSEDQTLNLSIDEPRSAAEEKRLSYVLVKNSVLSLANYDHQLFDNNPPLLAESPGQRGGKRGASGSTRAGEPKAQNRHLKSTSCIKEVHHSTVSEIHYNTQAD